MFTLFKSNHRDHQKIDLFPESLRMFSTVKEKLEDRIAKFWTRAKSCPEIIMSPDDIRLFLKSRHALSLLC